MLLYLSEIVEVVTGYLTHVVTVSGWLRKLTPNNGQAQLFHSTAAKKASHSGHHAHRSPGRASPGRGSLGGNGGISDGSEAPVPQPAREKCCPG